MRAAVLYKNETHLKIEEVPEKKVKPGEIKVKIECCGVCGSDLHITVHKQVSLKNYPRILGHEASGIVSEIGEGVENIQKGDSVILQPGVSCGHCKHCISGQPNYCDERGVLGFEVDGAFAESIVVKEKAVIKFPQTIPFTEAAILADAVSTPYHALKYQGRMQSGDVVAIIGCGGLGIHAVALAKTLGASKILAVDLDKGALENAESYGANILINPKNVKNIGKALKEESGGIDVLCDFSGYYKNIEDSLRAMNTGGRMVMVGIGKNSLNITFPMMIVDRQISITGSLGCDHRGVPELIELVASGKLNLKKSITSMHPLEEVNDCLENLHERKGNPIRFIIRPGE
ncbi:MAG: zinc-binding dehydrogenase [Leptospiraceae bacterium]|nr:zinc-binding dehydrogenase [Leptospiraceae bacterium]